MSGVAGRLQHGPLTPEIYLNPMTCQLSCHVTKRDGLVCVNTSNLIQQHFGFT